MRATSTQWLNSNRRLKLKLNSNNLSLRRGNAHPAVTTAIAANSARNAAHPNPLSTSGLANAAPLTKANSVLNAASPNPSATNGLANAARSTKANSAPNAASLARKFPGVTLARTKIFS